MDGTKIEMPELSIYKQTKAHIGVCGFHFFRRVRRPLGTVWDVITV